MLASILWILFSFGYVYTFVNDHIIEQDSTHTLFQTSTSNETHSEDESCYHLDFLLSLVFVDNTPTYINKPLCIIPVMNAPLVEALHAAETPHIDLRGPPLA